MNVARGGIAVAAAWLVMGGCGSDGSNGASTQAADRSTSAAPAPAAEAETKFEPVRTYRATTEKSDGSTAELELQLGRLERAGEAELPPEFESLPAACEADPKRSAVMPVRILVTNTTDGFPLTIPT